jgi:outer membrane protein TolC
MKIKHWVAGLLAVMFCLSSAMAQDRNFVESFLNRYRPRPNDASVGLVPGANDQILRSQLQNGTLPLTVDGLIRLILQSSLDVTAYRFSPMLNQYIISLNYLPFEPYFNLSSSVSRISQPSTSQLNGATVASTLSGSYSASIQQLLPTGTTYGASISINRSSSNSVFNTFNPYYSGSVNYSVSQQLLQNRGRLVNLKPVMVAKNNKKLSDLQFEASVIDLVANSESNYWDLVFAQKQIEVATRALELAQKLVHDDESQIRIGTMAPSDKVTAESAVASREFQKVATVYANDQIQDQVKRLISNVPDALVLAKLFPIDAVPTPKESDLMPIGDAVKYALENRVEMRTADVQLQNHDLDVMYTKNQLLPTLSVNAGYAQYGIGGVQRQLTSLGATTNAVIVSQGGLGDAFGQLFGFNYTGYRVGFNLQVPLTNRVAQADNARAMTDKRNAQNQKDLFAQNIALQVRTADSQIQMARAQITAALKAHELATQTLTADSKKLQLGTLAAPQLVITTDQQNLTQAETNEIQSYISYAKALILYDHALGRTLLRHNIQIDKEMTARNGVEPKAPGTRTAGSNDK